MGGQKRIIWVDEDMAFNEQTAMLFAFLGYPVDRIVDASRAYSSFCNDNHDDIGCYLIDVMLEPGHLRDRFSADRCLGYYITGVRLVEDLFSANKEKIGRQPVVLYTSATSDEIWSHIRKAEQEYGVRVFRKDYWEPPENFVKKVIDLIGS